MGQKSSSEWKGFVEERVHEMSDHPTRAWRMLGKKMTVNKITPTDSSLPRQPGCARFVCISDTHSRTENLQVPEGDVLIHAGDFSNVGEQEDIEKFSAFLDSLPHSHKVVIAGNHDLSFDEANLADLKARFKYDARLENVDPKALKDMLRKHCTYLEDEETTVMGFRIYGSPWQPRFGDWAFNLDRGEACLATWDRIPSGVDILVTHGPPLGHGDACYDGQRAGCVDLLQTIQKRVRPKYHVFGHIHEGYGVTTDGYTTFVNASTCTLRYEPSHPPIVFDLPVPTTRNAEEEGATT